MMISCLILYHSTITSLTKCKILRYMFHEDVFEIEVLNKNTVIIYVWNIKKEKVWQMALVLENTDIVLGYGFGKEKNDAKNEAVNLFHKWSAIEEEGWELSTRL